MHGNEADSSRVCRRCGKPLQYVACGACDGKGYHRKGLFLKGECRVCSGSGRVLRCPDEHRHAVDLMTRLRRSLEARPSGPRTLPIARRPPGSLQPRPYNLPGHPSPWHRMHPRHPRNQPFNPFNPRHPLHPRLDELTFGPDESEAKPTDRGPFGG
jgi:hypothetical protein